MARRWRKKLKKAMVATMAYPVLGSVLAAGHWAGTQGNGQMASTVSGIGFGDIYSTNTEWRADKMRVDFSIQKVIIEPFNGLISTIQLEGNVLVDGLDQDNGPPVTIRIPLSFEAKEVLQKEFKDAAIKDLHLKLTDDDLKEVKAGMAKLQDLLEQKMRKEDGDDE